MPDITSKYIDLFTDFGFKRVFGDQNDTEALKSLLNDILKLDNDNKIKTITFKNGELLPNSPEDRKAILDLYCTDEKDGNFIVELQRISQEHFQSRALYYTTFPIQEQAKRGKWDFELTPVYFIGLLNFEVKEFSDNEDFLHHGKITDIYTNKVMYQQLNMIYVEIPKMKKIKKDLSTHLEWWLWTFLNISKIADIPKELDSDEVIKNSFEKAEFLKLKKLDQENYHKNLKAYRDLINSEDFAIKRGIKQGIQQGIEKGEKNKQIEIAKNLLDVLDIETIALKTGLSIEEIENLISNKK